jgi:hypothetical protein
MTKLKGDGINIAGIIPEAIWEKHFAQDGT